MPIRHRLPYPIPFYRRLGITSLLDTHYCAIVFFVPADRIKQIPALWRAAIFERLAVDNVARHSVKEISGPVGRSGSCLLRVFRAQFLEGFGELPMRQTVALQSAGNRRIPRGTGP